MFFVHQANKRKGRPRRETWCGPAGLSTNSFIPIDFCKKKILIRLEGKSMRPEEDIFRLRSSQQFPCLLLRSLKGFLS